MYDLLNNSVAAAALVYVILNDIKYGRQRGIVSEKIISSKYFLCKKTDTGVFRFIKNRTLVSIIECVLLMYTLMLPLSFMNEIFGELFTGGSLNYFGSLFTFPLMFFPISIILGVNPIEYFDRLAPVYPLTLVPIKLACFCAGCCAGIECDHGLYFPANDEVQFPVQLVEAGCALIIFLILNKYRHNAKKGTVFPLFVILYCSTRFISEFWRGEENVFGVLKVYHILCLVGIAVGIAELAASLIYGERLYDLFERLLNGYENLLDKYVFIKKRKRKRKKEPKKVRQKKVSVFKK